MQIGRKHTKSIEQYRHNIKLLKYYLKKEQRINETLKYKSMKNQKKNKNKQQHNDKPKQRIYSMLDTVTKLNQRMKQMGLTLGDLFRMVDAQYEGQINKGQFLKVVNQLKADIQENLVQQLFYAIDTNLNGILDQDEYLQFLCAYGGADQKDAIRFQKKTLQKFGAQLKKKSIKVQKFLADSMNPISAQDFKKKLSGFGLNQNEIMILLKAFDPENSGEIIHELFIQQMSTVKEKSEQAIANEEMQKDIKYMCVQWRENKINPIKIFVQADADKKDGVSPAQLQEAFLQLMPNETKFNIKKWVKIINLNNDKQITREQFVNSIRSFYALNQMEKFSSDYEKQNPNAKKAINNEQVSIQSIIKQLQQKIQDSKMTKTQAFKSMDLNGDGTLSKEELTEGLKKFGFKIVFVGRILSVFDRNCSEGVQLEEWLKILGEDVEMEEIDMPESDFNEQPPKNMKDQRNNINGKDSTNIKNLLKNKEAQKQKENRQNQPKDSKAIKESKAVKDSKEVKNIKSVKKDDKKQGLAKRLNVSKQVKKKFQEDKDYEEQFQNQEQIEISKVQEQVGIKYKKRSQEVLQKFKKFSLRNKPSIGLSNLKTILQQLEVTFTEEQVQKIFEENIEAGGKMNYEVWLERIAETYAGDVQKQKPISKSKNSNKLQQVPKPKIKRTQSQQMDLSKNTRGKASQQQKQVKKVSLHKDIQRLIDVIEISEQLQSLRKQYLEKAKKLKSSKKKFVDEAFPANIKSITTDADKSRINNATQKVKFLKWKHYSEIYKNPSLVEGVIEPNDITQGALGNCYFLSALACLAEYPNLIQRLFQYYDLESGYFLVWLCIDGMWNLYELDGYIVVNAAGTEPYFAHNQKQQLWVMLLQKAYAKAYGCYENVIGGDPSSAIRDISGSPCQILTHANIKEDDLWKKLYEANKNKFIMATGTDQQKGPQKRIQGRPEGVTEEGLVLGHAYSILDLHEEGRQKIIQLRNPWGKVEWKGDWSDQSSKWTEKMRKKLNYYSNSEDGIFWMLFSQYFQRYKATSINFLKPTYFYQSSNQPGSTSLLVKASASNLNELYIIVNQQDIRHLGQQTQNEYVRTTFIPVVCEKDSQPVKVVRKIVEKTWKSSKQAQVNIPNINRNEQVLIMAKLQKQTNVNVAVYANCRVDFVVEQLSEEDEIKYSQAIAFEIGEDQKNQSNGLQYWVSSVGNKAFLCFKNKAYSSTKITVDISEVDNLKILNPQKIGKNVLKVEKGETKCIRAYILDLKKDYSFKNFSLS